MHDITGRQFERLTGLRFDRRVRKHAYWWFLCQCGITKSIRLDGVLKGIVRSCGCLKREHDRTNLRSDAGLMSNLRHGEMTGGSPSKEYRAWQNMISRCYYPSAINYDDYGGRGITVCERWLECVENFLEDMGRAPSPKHSLDRRNNNLGYFKENCRWATRREQNRNNRGNHLVTFNGLTLTVVEWSEKTGMTYSALKTRLDRGWSIDRVFSQPVEVRCYNLRN